MTTAGKALAVGLVVLIVGGAAALAVVMRPPPRGARRSAGETPRRPVSTAPSPAAAPSAAGTPRGPDTVPIEVRRASGERVDHIDVLDDERDRDSVQTGPDARIPRAFVGRSALGPGATWTRANPESGQ